MKIEVIDSIASVDAGAWDALVPADDPFATHAFLALLEESGSANRREGWVPVHLLVRNDAGTLMGAAPAYLKDHSYGEYIFDWGWANAAHRAGITYYPKVVSQVPFTPATGGRLLARPGPDAVAVRQALFGALTQVAARLEGSGAHVLFCTKDEFDALDGQPGVIGRLTYQFHWENQGWRDFDDYLSTYRSRDRKKVKRERRRHDDLGAQVRMVPGAEITDAQWAAVKRFYVDTCDRRGGHTYLTPRFFDLARVRIPDLIRLFVAEAQGRTVATALTFQRGRALYGRYWGCEPAFSSLHFELCYHAPIDLAIAEGLTRFEAGAQGGHKLKRGLLPRPTYSLHALLHAGLHDAVARAMAQERRLVEKEIAALTAHGPFRDDEPALVGAVDGEGDPGAATLLLDE